MNGRVHYWIVCDAVAYIKAHGDELQKLALQGFELSYGQKKSVEEIPSGKTAIERLAGFESWHTDKFGDLSIRVPVHSLGDEAQCDGTLRTHVYRFQPFYQSSPGSDKSVVHRRRLFLPGLLNAGI